MGQTILVTGLFSLAIFWMVRRLYRLVWSDQEGSCANCSLSQPVKKPTGITTSSDK